MTSRRIGRPPADPAAVARAVALVLAGASSAVDAARACGIGKTTLYGALEAARRAPRVSEEVQHALVEQGAAGGEGPQPPAALPLAPAVPPPAESATRAVRSTLDDDLGILDEEIAATRAQLKAGREKVAAGGSAHGLASLGKLLADLVRRRAELRPPARDDGDEERRWRADADAVITAIEAGVTAAEERLAGGRAA